MQGTFEAALEPLLMAEEALGLASPGVQAMTDNMAMLLLDIVWCVAVAYGWLRVADLFRPSFALVAATRVGCMARSA